MNNTKHTPAPWKCAPLDRNNRFVVFQPNEAPAQATRSTDEVIANARPNDADRPQWTLETIGWTWKRADGCIGLGRAPAKTLDEALAVMARVNGL